MSLRSFHFLSYRIISSQPSLNILQRRKNLKGSIRISQEKILLHRVLQVETGRRRKKKRRKEGNVQKAVHPAKLAAAPLVPLNQIPQRKGQKGRRERRRKERGRARRGKQMKLLALFNFQSSWKNENGKKRHWEAPWQARRSNSKLKNRARTRSATRTENSYCTSWIRPYRIFREA